MRIITVRDGNSADMVELITGERPEIVLDPVWLWDFNKDNNINLMSDRFMKTEYLNAKRKTIPAAIE